MFEYQSIVVMLSNFPYFHVFVDFLQQTTIIALVRSDFIIISFIVNRINHLKLFH